MLCSLLPVENTRNLNDIMVHVSMNSFRKKRFYRSPCLPSYPIPVLPNPFTSLLFFDLRALTVDCNRMWKTKAVLEGRSSIEDRERHGQCMNEFNTKINLTVSLDFGICFHRIIRQHQRADFDLAKSFHNALRVTDSLIYYLTRKLIEQHYVS